MEQYLGLLEKTLKEGEMDREERTGAGTKTIFGVSERWDLSDGKAAIVTTKKIRYDNVIKELLWFLGGNTNVKDLIDEDVHIWTSDALRYNLETVINEGIMTRDDVFKAQKEAKEAREVLLNYDLSPAERKKAYNKLRKRGKDLIQAYETRISIDEDFAQRAADLGPIYGAQWRGTNGANFGDQIREMEYKLVNNSSDRRNIVTAWNPSQKNRMALPPCHRDFQVKVRPESRKLDLMWAQRSWDMMLGAPYNIASYAALLGMFAEVHGEKGDFERGDLIVNAGDAHIYLPHIKAAYEQIQRTLLPQPQLIIDSEGKESILDISIGDISLSGPGGSFDYENRGRLKNPTPMFGGFL